MDKINPHRLWQAPRLARTPEEASRKGAELMATVDHFTAGHELSLSKGAERVAVNFLKERNQEVMLYRITRLDPSTGLKSAASSVAGAVGALLHSVAPGWSQSLKDWSVATSKTVRSVEYGRSLMEMDEQGKKSPLGAEEVKLIGPSSLRHIVRGAGQSSNFMDGLSQLPKQLLHRWEGQQWWKS